MNISMLQTLISRLYTDGGKVVHRVLRLDRRSPLWTMAGGIFVSIILFWVMVQLGQASSDPKPKASPPVVLAKPEPVIGSESTGLGAGAVAGAGGAAEGQAMATGTGPSAASAASSDVPREVIELLDQRKRELDRREEGVRQHEKRLLMVKEEVEKLLEKHETLEKQLQTAQAQKAQQAAKPQAPESQAGQRSKSVSEKDRVVQEQRTQLTKIYEAMPSEDAAARLERMPDRKAVEILRMVKPKTAGAILAQVKADRAAKLTEQLLAHE